MTQTMTDWNSLTLDDIAHINHQERLEKGKIYKSVPMDCIDSYTRRIYRHKLKEYKGGTKFRNGDTLFARITPCLENGKTAFVDFLNANEIGFGSTEFLIFREKEDFSDKKFLYYLSISPKFRDIAIKAMTGTSGRQRVQTDQLVNHAFLIPPLPEQQAIASILSSFDDKIELLREQNETLEKIAQTLFKEWFGKYSVDRPEELPEGWRVGELGDVCKLSAGGDKPKNSTSEITEENTIPIYSNGITNDGLYGYTNIPKITEESVTVSARGTIGFVCLRNCPYYPIVRLVSVVPNLDYLSGKYLFLRLRNKDIQGTGTTQQQLTVPVFKAYEIIIPGKNIMGKFTEFVDEIYDKIYSNNNQIQSLSKTRDALLPKLMSGKVRVRF